MQNEILTTNYGLRRIYIKILYSIVNLFFLTGKIRSYIYSLAGVKMNNPFSTFIGKDVIFDTVHPEDINIGENCVITSGTVLLSHFVDHEWNDNNHMTRGKINIANNVFIGMNTVIVKSINIGNGAIIGANSVLTKDIPPYTIWGGNPAVQIKKRIIKH